MPGSEIVSFFFFFFFQKAEQVLLLFYFIGDVWRAEMAEFNLSMPTYKV